MRGMRGKVCQGEGERGEKVVVVRQRRENGARNERKVRWEKRSLKGNWKKVEVVSIKQVGFDRT